MGWWVRVERPAGGGLDGGLDGEQEVDRGQELEVEMDSMQELDRWQKEVDGMQGPDRGQVVEVEAGRPAPATPLWIFRIA